MRRCAKAQPVAGDLKCPRHHWVQAERPLEIGQNVVGVLGGVIFGNHAIGLDRRARIARIADGDRDAMRCLGKGALGITVAERAVAGDI